jgi:hypothetical protein
MAKKPKKPRSRPFDPENIWVAVQEGGSSGEIYLHSFDCHAEAEKYEKHCEKASYNCLLVESIQRSDTEKAAPFAYVAMKAALRDLRAIDPLSRLPSIDSLKEAIRRMEKDERLLDACRASGLPIPK